MKKFYLVLLIVSIANLFSSLNALAQNFSEQKIVLKTMRYDMDIHIDYEKEVLSNICKMEIFNPSGNSVKSIPLVLYRLIKVNSVKDVRGANISFTQRLETYVDDPKKQVNYIEVKLENPIRPGGRITIVLDTEGFLCGNTEVNGYVHDRIDPGFTIIRNDPNAFPRLGVPSRLASLDAILNQSFDFVLIVTVPDTLMVANGGRLVDKVLSNGNVTFTYESIKPSWRIDIAISRYRMFEDGKNKIFCFPEDTGNAEVILSALKNTLDLYTKWFGPLRSYSGLTVIEIPDGWGSQSDVTTIIQTAAAFKDVENIYEFYHELSHQWNVKSTDLPSPRLEEGLACFLQFLTVEELENRKTLKKSMDRYLNYINNSLFKYEEYVGIPMKDYGVKDVTRLSYTVGAVFYYLIFETMGHEEFISAIGTFYQDNFEKGASTDEFIVYLRQQSTKDINKIINDWYSGTKYIEFIMNELTIDEIVGFYK